MIRLRWLRRSSITGHKVGHAFELVQLPGSGTVVPEQRALCGATRDGAPVLPERGAERCMRCVMKLGKMVDERAKA